MKKIGQYNREIYLILPIQKQMTCHVIKKRKILGKKQRGYASLIINENMMQTLNEENGVRETLHNMVKYSSSSNFVFQKEIKSKRSSSQKVIQNSSTR